MRSHDSRQQAGAQSEIILILTVIYWIGFPATGEKSNTHHLTDQRAGGCVFKKRKEKGDDELGK